MQRKLSIALVLSLLAANAAADDHQQYEFRVLLDGDEIGTHNYTITESDDGRVVQSDAKFDVRFLFITAYRYRHSNTERWNGDCLREMSSQTNANGKQVAVSGELDDEAFVLSLDDGERNLPACVSSFAYWDVDFLQERKLLNPQTGEYVAVDVENLGSAEILLGEQPVQARHYRLTGEGLELDLWYSSNDDWLALQSVAKGGRLLRYERVGDSV